ncbi:hypothetical protein C8Q80DRAFT_443186 [Daedaleopsis nitida]|nr:hypothetical protein C8Q80DRAFT_443186 [Daedaleopsis nitida]
MGRADRPTPLHHRRSTVHAIWQTSPGMRSWYWILALSLALVVRAGTLLVEDNDPGVVYNGTWVADGSPNAQGSHETWTDQQGASVYYDFRGTQVKVYATLRPTGSYLTNVSFAIDDETPTLWTTTEFVEQETFNRLVYTSPDSLSSDQLHRILITNYGVRFWLVYMEITTVDPTSGGAQPSQTGNPTSTTSSDSTSSSNTALIVGVVVGVLGGMALLAAGICCLRIRSRMREQEKTAFLVATPFAALPATRSSSHFSKDRPPENPPSRFHRWLSSTLAHPHLASEPANPSTISAAISHTEPRAQSARAPDDDETARQLAADGSPARRPLPAPPHARIPPGTGPASIPSGPQTPSATARTHSTGPASRSAWLARAFSLSSAHFRDPGHAASSVSSPLFPPTNTSESCRSGSGSSAPPTRPLYFRLLRRSRDGGVRLAGGSLQELEGGVHAAWTAVEYEEAMEAMSERSTLPPSYQQFHAGSRTSGPHSPASR